MWPHSILLVLLGCESAIGRATPAHTTIPAGEHPVELAAGDLDGNGRVDIVAANRDGTIVVRLQQADGTWRAAPGDPPRMRAHMVALGDIDADGVLDLVTTDHDSGEVAFARGTGTGQFRAIEKVRAITTAKPHNHGLVAIDLDRDGDTDVVVADQTAKQLVVLLSNGRTLEARPPIALPDQAYPPAAGDLDRDGRPDIVVPLVGDRAVAVLLNKGNGELAPPRTFATTRERPYGVAVGDVDGNGTADVVVSHDDTNTVVVMAGDGKGGLVEQRALELPGRIGRPLLVDVDGDGALDLVGAGSGRLVIAPRARPPIRSEAAGGWRVIAADFDGDGKLDLAAPEPERGVVRLWISRTEKRRAP